MNGFNYSGFTELSIWRQRLAQLTMRALVIFGGFTVCLAIYQSYLERDFFRIAIYLAIYVPLVLITVSRRASYQVQASVAMALFGVFASLNLLQYGLNADSGLLLLAITLIATLFFGKRGGHWATIAVLLVMLTVAVLFVSQVIVVYNVRPIRSADWKGWAITTTLLLALSAGLAFAQNYLLERLTDALEQSHQLTRELEAERTGLEKQIIERTHSVELAREEADEAQRALEAQMWQVSGQAALSEAMRGEQDIVTLADNVIRQLCQHLDVQVGTLFVREGDLLRPAGGYAHTATVDTFRLGEGVIGQAALEDALTTIPDIPTSHLRVASGFGDIIPRHVLVSPFVYEGEVVGVVELGALQPFALAQKTFVAGVMESIAIVFDTAQTRMRVDELLIETQQQAEELQAQEEELRAANEELEAQMESLRASEARLREKQEALEALNDQLEAEKASRRQG